MTLCKYNRRVHLFCLNKYIYLKVEIIIILWIQKFSKELIIII